MEITTARTETHVELTIAGRLDAYWADHLTAALDDALRQGSDRIRLDMAAVEYMSSVGIRVLLRFYKEANRLQGSFAVRNPSPAVRSVLELAGLEALLISGEEPAPSAVGQTADTPRRIEQGGALFEMFDLAPGATLDARLIGRTAPPDDAFSAADCHTLRAGESVLALGLGALGRDFDDCRGRFGEFLAVAGAAAYLPTDGTNAPDCLVATGAFVPELRVLNAVVCEGHFARMTRFEAQAGRDRVTLQALVEACLSLADTSTAAIAIVAESAGLMGAALRRSPAAPSPDGPAGALGGGLTFALPAVRDWLSFTPERAFSRSLAVVVGVAARRDAGALTAYLRPMAADSELVGHFHAAAFPYQPLRKGRIDLHATIAAVFESAAPHGVLHLLNDDRPIVGSGQSEFVRGACWIGSIADVRGGA